MQEVGQLLQALMLGQVVISFQTQTDESKTFHIYFFGCSSVQFL
jgi:hypothetical protein